MNKILCEVSILLYCGYNGQSKMCHTSAIFSHCKKNIYGKLCARIFALCGQTENALYMPYIRKRSAESGPASLIRLCAKESTERTRVNVEPRLKNWVFSPKESCCTLRQTMFARLHQLNVSLGNFWAKQEKILRRPRPFRSLQIVSLQKAWKTNAFRICKGSFCRLQAHGLWKYTQACFSRKTKHFGFLLNLCFLRRKMQTACTHGNAQHVDDAGFCQQVNFATGNCHNLFVRQNTLFASCFEKSQSNKLPLHGKNTKKKLEAAS